MQILLSKTARDNQSRNKKSHEYSKEDIYL